MKHVRNCAFMRSSRWRYTELASNSDFMILKDSYFYDVFIILYILLKLIWNTMVNTANGSEISTGIMYCLQYTSSWSSEPRKWHSGFRKIKQRIARMTLNPNATAISSEKISPASKHHPQSRCHINHRHRNINRRQSIRIYPTGNKNPVHGCIQVSNYFSPLFLFIFGAFFFTFSSKKLIEICSVFRI